MKIIDQLVIPLGNGWVVKASGSKKYTIISDSKRFAIKAAKEIAGRRRSKLIIYDKDMNIIQSYVPPPPKIDMN